MRRLLLPALLALATCGCAAGVGDAAGFVPALRTDATEAGSSELAAAGARLVGATRLLLAEDAFRADAELALERRRGPSLEGAEDGLDLSGPLVLRLEWQDGSCRLRRVGTAEVVALTGVRCTPFPD